MREFLSKNKWPLLVAAAAILVRIIYLMQISHQPGFSVLMVDEQWHWLWAQEIVEKSFWGDGSYFRGPLYPYFLAVLYLISGGSIFAAKFLQILLCGVTAVFIFKLAEHLFRQKAALVAGFIYAIYGTLVFYETMFLIPALFLMLTVWGMYRLIFYQDRNSNKSWIVTGILFGLAALARPNILFVVPFLALWLFFKHKKPSASFIASANPALVWIIGIVIAIAPVTIRNMAVTGDFILISSQGGINLYLGNNEYADGLMMIMPELELDNTVNWKTFVPLTNEIAKRETGRQMSDAEISSFWTGKAFNFVTGNPGKFVSLCWQKTVYLMSGFENSDAVDIYHQRKKSSVYSILVWDRFLSFPFGLLLPLAIMGVYVLRKDYKKLLPLYVFILAYAPTVVFFLVTARHRLPIIPFLIIIAATGTVRIVQNFKGYSGIKKLLLPTVLITCIFVFNQKYYLLGEPNPFFIHFNEGLTYQRLGDFQKAEQEYLLADAIFPYSAALAVNLGEVQIQLDKIEVAEKNLHRAIALKPEMAMSYNDLGLVVKRKGNLDSAAALFNKAISLHNPNSALPNDIGGFYVNLADTYKKLQKYDSAAEAYHQAMTQSPLFDYGFYQAAQFYTEIRQFEISDSLYKEAMRVKLPNAAQQYNLGLTYVEREMYTDAVSMMNRVLKKDENFYQAWYVIGAIYNKFGEPQDSVDYYINKCLAIEPNYEPALKIKQGKLK